MPPWKAGAVEERSVSDLMDEYLESKGWAEGENKKGGGIFYIARGIGVVQVPVDSRAYADSRANAYDKAMLAAKAQMAEYLEVVIRAEAEHDYAEGKIDANAEDGVTGIGAGVRRLVVTKLDAALQEEGVDPATAGQAARRRVAKGLLSSELFRKVVSTAAKAEVQGMQACCCFEGVSGGKSGEIGVVAVWSPKLQAMARALSLGTRLPAGVGKKAVRDQIPQDKRALLSTFGVQQKVDENGQLVLVGFGQAGAATDSPASRQAAQEKAKLRAMAAIREFAGETVAVARDSVTVESVEEFENAAGEYEDLGAYRQKIKAAAESLAIRGITTVRRWECRHPLSGRVVYGVVCSWSPGLADRARSLERGLGAPGPSASADARPPAHSAAAPGGSMRNKGADADEDAF